MLLEDDEGDVGSDSEITDEGNPTDEDEGVLGGDEEDKEDGEPGHIPYGSDSMRLNSSEWWEDRKDMLDDKELGDAM